MGVWMEGSFLRMKVYSGSRTYELLRNGAKYVTICIPSKVELFVDALLEKHRLTVKRFEEHWFALEDCEAIVATIVERIEQDQDSLSVYLIPTKIEVLQALPKPFRRFDYAILEMLVILSKAMHGKLSMPENEVETILRYLTFVIRRTAKDPRLMKLLEELSHAVRNLVS